MTVLGQVFVYLAFASALASAFTFAMRTMPGERSPSLSRSLLRASVLFVVLASAFLVALLVTHDYSNGYVFGYSDRSLPLHYLISSFYAGQEGSFLFWSLASALLALALLTYTRKRASEPWVMAIFMAVQAYLLLLVIAKSPFRTIWEMYPTAPPGQIPPDGKGLNPLLQNFWMVIHPPVLFIGFAAMAVPFSQAIGGMWQKRYQLLPDHGLSWVLFGSAVLGLGIMLGAYWAYGVLGWGGYWGWDPVENSSLVPWLTSLALVHTLLAQRRTGKFPRTNLLLAVVTFFLVIYSTFLTRSGILGDASVHSFTDPGASIYWLLIAFLGSIIAVSVFFAVRSWSDLKPPVVWTGWFSRESALIAGAIVIVLSAVVVLFGTSLPIFSKTRVEPAFYDATNLPLAIVMALLIGASLYMQWEESDAEETAKKSRLAFGAAVAVTAVCVVAGMHDPMTSLLVFTSLFALFVNIDIGLKIIKGDPLFLGGKIAHCGIALFLLGVVSTGKYATTEQVQLPLNVPKQVLGHTLTYVGQRPTADHKFAFDVRVQEAANTFTMSPVMFQSGEQGVMKNPDIASSLTRDLYLSPIGVQEGVAGDASGGESRTLPKGQPDVIRGVGITFTRFDMGQHTMGQPAPEGIRVGVQLELQKGKEREVLTPVVFYRSDGTQERTPVESRLLQAPVKLMQVNVGDGSIPSVVTIEVERPGATAVMPEVLILDASVKPFINLLWAGTVVMLCGFALAILKRFRE